MLIIDRYFLSHIWGIDYFALEVINMKQRLIKTFGSLFLAVALCLSISVVAFAADNTVSHIETSASRETEISPMGYGEYDSGEIPRKGELILYPVLNSYVGLSRTFYLMTDNIYSDTIPSGSIRVYVYKPNGDLLKYFTVGPQEDYTIKCTLPSSGTYTVRLYSDVNEKILATAGWTA